MATLSAEDIEHFEQKGFLLRRSLFKKDDIEILKPCFDKLIEKSNELKVSQDFQGSHFVLDSKNNETIIKRVVWAGGVQPNLLAISEDKRLINIISQLLGSQNFEQLLNQAHFKLPGDGVEFPWHQDIEHRSKSDDDWIDVNGKGSYVQTILAIDDMTLNNGPLKVIPSSHKWGRLKLGGDGYDSTPASTQQIEKADKSTLTMKSGDVLFFGPLLVHASFANKSTKARRVLINGYAYPGANHRIYPGKDSGRLLKMI